MENLRCGLVLGQEWRMLLVPCLYQTTVYCSMHMLATELVPALFERCRSPDAGVAHNSLSLAHSCCCWQHLRCMLASPIPTLAWHTATLQAGPHCPLSTPGQITSWLCCFRSAHRVLLRSSSKPPANTMCLQNHPPRQQPCHDIDYITGKKTFNGAFRCFGCFCCVTAWFQRKVGCMQR